MLLLLTICCLVHPSVDVVHQLVSDIVFVVTDVVVDHVVV